MGDLSKTIGVMGAASGVLSGLSGANKRPIGKTIKRTALRGVGGLAAGTVAGSSLDYLDRKSKETPAQEWANKAGAYHSLRHASEALRDLEKMAAQLRRFSKKQLTALSKSPANDLDPIVCEVCAYNGNPANDGTCPQCGAVGGQKVKPRKPDFNIFYNEADFIPKDGISVFDADHLGRNEFAW